MRSAQLRTPLGLVGALLVSGLACSSMTSPTATTPASDVLINKGASTLGSSAFAPNPFTVSLTGAKVGKVTWANGDYTSTYSGTTGTTHHLVSDTGVWDSGAMGPAAVSSFTFTTAGSYPYHCSIHLGMTGTITVTP